MSAQDAPPIGEARTTAMPGASAAAPEGLTSYRLLYITGRVLLYLALTIVGVTMLLPLLWMVLHLAQGAGRSTAAAAQVDSRFRRSGGTTPDFSMCCHLISF